MSSRLRQRVIVPLLVASLIGTGAPAPATATRSVASLDGRPIPLTRMARLHCHDLDGGAFRCFRTERALSTALARMISRPFRPGGASIQAVSYVRLYEHELYAGASIALSQDYPNLSSIGWNDRMTSFKVLNSGDGSMHRDSQYQSGSYGFCCTTQVSNVGSSWNDVVSSVQGSA